MAPFWVALWLVAATFGPAPVWTHFDGSLCHECSFEPVAATQDFCCIEVSNAIFSAELAANAADDCQSCCVASVSESSASAWAPSFSPAITKAPPQFVVLHRERRVAYAYAPRLWASFSRPPPLGRGPPLENSISPL